MQLTRKLDERSWVQITRSNRRFGIVGYLRDVRSPTYDEVQQVVVFQRMYNLRVVMEADARFVTRGLAAILSYAGIVDRSLELLRRV